MHIELIGCTSAGKTTLAQKIVDVGKSQGIDVTLGEDFVLRRLYLNWVKNEFIRRRVLEICAASICLQCWPKYGEFCRFVFSVVFQAPGSWLYKVNLARIVLRKIGLYEVIRRNNSDQQIVLVDNEGIVQAAHNLFVHSGGRSSGDLSNFIKSAPLPDVVAYLRQPESILLERTLKRGHPRIRTRSLSKVQHFIKQAAKTFEELQRLPQIADRLFVIDSENKTMIKLSSRNGQLIDRAYDLMQTSIKDVHSEREPERTPPNAGSDTPCLKLVSRLVELLNAQDISYCHWKSNIDLKKSLDGEADLDLFVGRKSVSQILYLLAELGFKAARIRYGPETSGVTHYYGFDAMTGKLVHVHLFTVMLTGESFVKSHRLPFEKMVLENCDRMGPVVIASKAAELVLFVLRTFIKYSSLPDMHRLSGQSAQVRKEFKWLLDNSDLTKAVSLLRTYCPVVDEPLFLKCIDVLNKHSFIATRAILARRVRRRLRIYAKYTPLGRHFAYVQVVWAQVRRRVTGNRKNKMLQSGGAIIAFVGADATGKSTLVCEIGSWLGEVFAVRTVHVGKPPSSWITAPVNLALPLASCLWPQMRCHRLEGQNRLANPSQSQSKLGTLSSLLIAIRAVTLAWDRRRTVNKAWRAAANGEIVICDRYPSEEIGRMDSPRLREQPSKGSRIAILYNWLALFEQRLYKHIPPPDMVMTLKVSIATAKKRNRERIKSDKHEDDYLEARHRQSQEWHKPGTKHVHAIDTDMCIEETILKVKKTVWQSL